MKIGKTNEAMQPDVPERVGARPAGGAGPAPALDGVAQTDSVELSPQSLALSATSQDPIDATKVATVSAAIANGQFKVDAQKVADRMINEAAQLLERITSGDGAS